MISFVHKQAKSISKTLLTKMEYHESFLNHKVPIYPIYPINSQISENEFFLFSGHYNKSLTHYKRKIFHTYNGGVRRPKNLGILNIHSNGFLSSY